MARHLVPVGCDVSGIHVHITVSDANGKNANVAVTEDFVPGRSIHEAINMLAAETASMAQTALSLDSEGEFLHRDKRQRPRLGG